MFTLQNDWKKYLEKLVSPTPGGRASADNSLLFSLVGENKFVCFFQSSLG